MYRSALMWMLGSMSKARGFFYSYGRVSIPFFSNFQK